MLQRTIWAINTAVFETLFERQHGGFFYVSYSIDRKYTPDFDEKSTRKMKMEKT